MMGLSWSIPNFTLYGYLSANGSIGEIVGLCQIYNITNENKFIYSHPYTFNISQFIFNIKNDNKRTYICSIKAKKI